MPPDLSHQIGMPVIAILRRNIQRLPVVIPLACLSAVVVTAALSLAGDLVRHLQRRTGRTVKDEDGYVVRASG